MDVTLDAAPPTDSRSAPRTRRPRSVRPLLFGVAGGGPGGGDPPTRPALPADAAGGLGLPRRLGAAPRRDRPAPAVPRPGRGRVVPGRHRRWSPRRDARAAGVALVGRRWPPWRSGWACSPPRPARWATRSSRPRRPSVLYAWLLANALLGWLAWRSRGELGAWSRSACSPGAAYGGSPIATRALVRLRAGSLHTRRRRRSASACSACSGFVLYSAAMKRAAITAATAPVVLQSTVLPGGRRAGGLRRRTSAPAGGRPRSSRSRSAWAQARLGGCSGRLEHLERRRVSRRSPAPAGRWSGRDWQVST